MIFPTVHVYKPGNIPGDSENTRTAQYVEYGTKFSGVIFANAFIHDKPETPEDQRWIDEDLAVRMAQGGVIRVLESPSLHDTSKPHDNRGPSTHGLPIIKP